MFKTRPINCSPALVLSLVMAKSVVFWQMGLFHKCLQNTEVLKLLPIAEHIGDVISLTIDVS